MREELLSHTRWLDNPENGKRLVIKKRSVIGVNFMGYDLSDAIIAHSDLTGCRFGKCHRTNFVGAKGVDIDFSRADITNTTFELADLSGMNLVGAMWRNLSIEWIRVFYAGGKFVLQTNAFIQIVSKQKMASEWECDSSIQEWWNRYQSIIHQRSPTGLGSDWSVCWSSLGGIQWLALGRCTESPPFDATSVGIETCGNSLP